MTATPDGSPKSPPLANTAFSRYRSTLLFCDIRGFTQFFDQCPPEETYLFVTTVISRLAKVVVANEGRISNLTGDGFLAQFGSPEPRRPEIAAGSHETDAIRCAIQVREELAILNRERHFNQDFNFSLGIGINTGMVDAENRIVPLGTAQS